MKKIPFPLEHEVSRIGLTTDWHSDNLYGIRVRKHLFEQGADILIHLGDFNLDNNKHLLDVQESLSVRNKILLLVEGNHCNIDFIESFPVDDDGVRRITENVWHLPRGFTWEWFGVRFMALGGAHSVNRRDLVPGVSWWKRERLTWDDAYHAVKQGKIDVLLSHDCPAGVSIPDLKTSSALFPPEEIVAAETHRALLRAIVDEIQPSQIFHGHYHQRYSSTLLTDWGVLNVDGLGSNETPIHENAIVYDLITKRKESTKSEFEVKTVSIPGRRRRS